MARRTDMSKTLIVGSEPSALGRLTKMMRIAFIPVLLVSVRVFAVNINAAMVIPLCPSNMPAQKSSAVLRITAQASPLKGTKIDLYSYKLGSRSSPDTPNLILLRSFITDEKGRIKTPELSPGKYCVAASGVHNQFAQLLVDVAQGRKAGTTKFTMHLVAAPEGSVPRPPHPQWTPADDQMPIQKRVPAFRGIVTDVSGAVIPDAMIDIVKKGTDGKEHVAELKTGPDGRFLGELSPGFYIAFFYAFGFKDQTIAFEITKEGTGNIDVVLPISNLSITSLDLPKNAKKN